jgi:hypothetical protein
VGTGPGALGRFLAARGCVVDGIEGDAATAAVARPYYRHLITLDLDGADVRSELGSRRYDAIVCADVLEHLRDPAHALEGLIPLLSPVGRLFVSVPNVGYAGLVATLLRGDFPYGPLGLLDATHLRFFTRRSLVRLLEAHGLGVVSMDAIARPTHLSEFSGEFADALAPALVAAILALPDALTYQLVAEAVPGAATSAEVASSARPRVTFGVGAYWRVDGARFDEAHRVIAAGEVGAARQRLLLALPLAVAGATELRVDVADRPGFLRVHGLRLLDRNGAITWSVSQPSIARMRASSQISELTTAGDRWWITTGDDPWIVPIIDVGALAAAAGGALELELDWPMAPRRSCRAP